MLKKFFTILILFSVTYFTLSQLQIQAIQTEEDYEEEGIKLFDKGVAVANEIAYFGENTNLNKKVIDWGKTQNSITRTIDTLINYIIFPMTITINIINLLFNCVSIITDQNWRTSISTTSIFYTSDYTSGTSYGGGGGGYSGGR